MKTKKLKPQLITSTDDRAITFVRLFDTLGLIKATKHEKHEAWRRQQYLGTYEKQTDAVNVIMKAERVAPIDQPLTPAQLLKFHDAYDRQRRAAA